MFLKKVMKMLQYVKHGGFMKQFQFVSYVANLSDMLKQQPFLIINSWVL